MICSLRMCCTDPAANPKECLGPCGARKRNTLRHGSSLARITKVECPAGEASHAKRLRCVSRVSGLLDVKACVTRPAQRTCMPRLRKQVRRVVYFLQVCVGVCDTCNNTLGAGRGAGAEDIHLRGG